MVTLEFGKGNLNLNTSFPHPNNVLLAVWSKSMHWFTRYTADKAHFYSLNSVVTLQIGSRSPNCLIILMILVQYMKLGLNPSFGTRDRVQTSFCWVQIWHSKYWFDLENKAKVTKTYSLLSLVPMVFQCKFGQNPPIGSGDSVQTRLDKGHFYSLCCMVTLKIRWRSPKSNQTF